MELSDRGDLKADNLIVWEKIIQELFTVAIPNNCQWEDIESISSVLNKINSVDSVAHTLFPVGGGHDIIRVERSTEKETIELRTPHSVRIVKPKVLEFNYFTNHIDWAYFRLETGGLKPITPNLDLSLIKEKLTEIEPGRYVEKEIWEKGYLGYDKNGYRILLPKTARLVSRYFKGSFVIFAQNSLYNKNHVTYDARHDRMNGKKFRQYIEKSILNLSSNS